MATKNSSQQDCETAPADDGHIRRALRSMLATTHLHEADTRIIEELGLCRGQVRVDVAVVNGLLHGYEIKSDRDSLRRLYSQVEIYSRVLDRATLVVGQRHYEKATALLPRWWGVVRVHTSSSTLSLKVMRRGRKNPTQDPRALVELLWRDDAIALLERHDAVRGVRGKPRYQVWDRVCESCSVEEISGAVRKHLKARPASQAPRPPV